MSQRISVRITVSSEDEGATHLCSEALRIGRPPGIYLERYEAIEPGRVTWAVDVDLAELIKHAPWVRDELGEASDRGLRR